MMQFILQGREERLGYEHSTGKTPDISECCDFDFYDLVWYWPNTHPPLTKNHREIAKWAGVAHRIGSDMCYWLIPKFRKQIADTTVHNVTDEDMRNPDIKETAYQFEKYLRQILDDTNFNVGAVGSGDFYLDDIYENYPAYEDDSNTPSDSYYNAPDEFPDADDIEQYDKLVGATFLLDPNTGDNKNICAPQSKEE